MRICNTCSNYPKGTRPEDNFECEAAGLFVQCSMHSCEFYNPTPEAYGDGSPAPLGPDDQTVYFVICEPGDPEKANREWPWSPDGQAFYLGLDPQYDDLEVWLWFVRGNVDVYGLAKMPFVRDIQPLARRLASQVPPLPVSFSDQ